jgi:hypothetical protein
VRFSEPLEGILFYFILFYFILDRWYRWKSHSFAKEGNSLDIDVLTSRGICNFRPDGSTHPLASDIHPHDHAYIAM